MQIYVMLTVDLNRGVSEDARRNFNETLKSLQWIKLKLTTTWQAKFKDGVTAEEALRTAKLDLRQAALVAGISSYEGAATQGTSLQPSEIKSARRTPNEATIQAAASAVRSAEMD